MTIFHVLKYDSNLIITDAIFNGTPIERYLPIDICNKFREGISDVKGDIIRVPIKQYVSVLKQVLMEYEGPLE